MENSTQTSSNDSYNLWPSSYDSYDFWLQVYCLNPPNDSCDFGPCPNPDVTGIGQQISLYISSTALAVVTMYSPADFEKNTYAYLVNIYAFLLSALFSLVQSNLTQNDAVFVLVAVASPVTLYLWFKLLIATFFRRISLLAIGVKGVSQVFFFVAVLGSLVMWLTMVGIIVGSPSGVSFSQQGCNSEYGLNAIIYMLAWPVYCLSQLLSLVIGLNIAVPGLPRRFRFAKDRTVLTHGTLEPNLLHWTRDSLIILWPTMMQDRRMVTFIVFILQIFLTMAGPLLNLRGVVFPGIATIAVLFILLDYIYDKHRHKQEPSIYMKKIIFISTAFILIFVFSFVLSPPIDDVFFQIRSLDIIPVFTDPFPSLDIILLFSVLSPVWWVNAPRIYRSRQVLVSRGLFILSICLAVINQIYNPLPVVLTLCWWIVPWAHATSIETQSHYTFLNRQKKLWSKISNCGAFLKFMLFIVNPTASWVVAMIATKTDLTGTFALSFGQFLSIFTAIIPTWTLISLCWKKRYEIRNAVWMIEEHQESEIILPVSATPSEMLRIQIPEDDQGAAAALDVDGAAAAEADVADEVIVDAITHTDRPTNSSPAVVAATAALQTQAPDPTPAVVVAFVDSAQAEPHTRDTLGILLSLPRESSQSSAKI